MIHGRYNVEGRSDVYADSIKVL
jgi:hypothetical protein